ATEITSDTEPSDNPIHQRLLKAYVIARDVVHGDLLEVGCGEGRGIGLLIDRVTSFTAIDKIDEALAGLRKQWPQGTFISGNIPPFGGLPDNAFDTVISFQVIEHIQDDTAFLREIHRVLKPGGKAWLTTPNRPMSLTRNPWHIREYTGPELLKLAASIFSKAEMKGIGGNEKVMAYHEENRQSVRRFTRWDIFNLQYRLPASLLRIPYEILNRLNRKNLKRGNEHLVSGITHEDYPVMNTSAGALDLLLMVEK
ncbi:MAG: class I SAM-dependent methyltransferase, partial [Bacteroidota bacterium]